MATPLNALALHLLDEDHALEPGRDYLLGSAGDCDFRLPAPAAAHHAQLAITAGTIEITDLGSAAGTCRNGERIERAFLQIGDVVRMGDVEAIVVADHGAAILVPIPALRAAAETRRLRAIGEQAALVVRRRDAETFQDLMAEELRRTPWLLSSIVLHALLLLLLWTLLPDNPPGGRPDAVIGILLGADSPQGEETPGPPEVLAEPPAASFDALPVAAQEILDVAIALPEAVTGHDVPRSNPRIAASVAAHGSGTSDPITDGVRSVGSGGFRHTVAELQRTGLEIVFVFDSTGSMTSTIADTKATIAQMLAVLRALVPDARVGIVTYRDRGREFYRVRELPLGVDFWRTSNFVQFVSAEGGGDRPEDVRAGLQAAFAQHWRPNARRVVVLAGDAPPHEGDQKGLLIEVRAFARNGRSFVHTLVTSPGSAGPDTRQSFADIAAAGKGTCTDLGAHERVLQRVLSLAFGREFDQDIDAVIRTIEATANRVDVNALDLARRGGHALLREMRRDPVPLVLVSALVRRPRQAVALELVEMLRTPGTPEHTLQAVAWVLQRILELPVPPVDPSSSERPTERELDRLRRRCINLPQ